MPRFDSRSSIDKLDHVTQREINTRLRHERYIYAGAKGVPLFPEKDTRRESEMQTLRRIKHEEAICPLGS